MTGSIPNIGSPRSQRVARIGGGSCGQQRGVGAVAGRRAMHDPAKVLLDVATAVR
jgi:hypothetical protein